MITRVEKRIELWTHHNVSYQEDIQVLRYSNFQKYGGWRISKAAGSQHHFLLSALSAGQSKANA